jgi:hypothetical protein
LRKRRGRGRGRGRGRRVEECDDWQRRTNVGVAL